MSKPKNLKNILTKDILEDLYFNQNKSCKEIGKIFNRNKQYVYYWMEKFNIKLNSPPLRWTNIELNFLKQNARYMTIEEMFTHFNRSKSGIYQKLFELNILLKDEWKKGLLEPILCNNIYYFPIRYRKTEIFEFTLIDKDNFHLVKNLNLYLRVGKWCRTKYVQFLKNKKGVYLHRLIMNFPNRDIEIDHINGNGLDNRKCNLRLCNRAQNSYNSKKRYGNSSSKYKGVTLNSVSNKYISRIIYNKKYIYIGLFKNETDAAIAYNKRAKELFGEYARLNKVN